MDLALLKTEITTDPAALGYAGKTDEQISNLMNAETGTGSNFEINRKDVTGAQIAAAMVPSEFTALTASDRAYVQCLASVAVPIKANEIRSDMMNMFPTGGGSPKPLTRAKIDEVFKITVSRAVKVLGEPVNPSNVADAKRLP